MQDFFWGRVLQMEERRQYHRYMLHTDIEHIQLPGQVAQESVTKDISRGGVCITTTGEPLQKDCNYLLRFILPFSDIKIEAVARVVWFRGENNIYDNGLCFVQIDERSLNQIEEFSIGAVEEKEG